MKTLLFIVMIMFPGWVQPPVQKTMIILLDSTSITSMGETYTVWYGITQLGQPASGLIPKKQDLRLGDLIIVKKYPTDTAWTFVKRISHNR